MSYKLKAHMNKEHSNSPIQLFACEVCGKEYKKKRNMRDHAKSHFKDPNIVEPKFKCDICQQSFNTKQTYNHHLNLHAKKFECEECGKIFGNTRNFERHNQAHSGIK